MNSTFPDLLFNGIIICIYIQLFILGSFKIFSKNIRSKLLGLLCVIIATSTIYDLYWPLLRSSFIFNILLGGQKTLIYGSLVFLYLRLAVEKDKKQIHKLLQIYLIIPIALILGYVVVKFYFSSFYRRNFFNIYMLFIIFHLLIYSYFLAISKQLFKKLKKDLKGNVYKQYRLFYSIFFIYSIIFSLDLFITSFTGRSEENYAIVTRYIYNPSRVIFSAGIFLFTIIETKYIKAFFTDNNLLKPTLKLSDTAIIKNFINDKLKGKKLYINVNFDIKKVLAEENINEIDFKTYLAKNYGKTYVDFLNDLRVEEFKNLIVNPNSNNYDIPGIAHLCGFNSKATFYRVFKAKEGITPLQYKKSL